MKRIYVAGRYSADNVIDVLKNIGRGQDICARLFSLGYYPFCPWHDKTYVTDRPENNFTVEQFQAHSMAWLEVSDGILMTSGWSDSRGSVREMERALELKIPVFYSVRDLVEHFGYMDREKRWVKR